MALGFQDCCNTSNYFYLNGIPATVSEFEVYYIETTQGENFCATYVNVPTLNYQPPTYDLLVMTQQTDCETCTDSYSCPSEETIFLNQFGAGSVATGTDCYIKTIFPMYVECSSSNPTALNLYDGQVSIYVTGGTTPYVFYSGNTNQVIGPNTLPISNVFSVFPNATQGTYSIRVVDKYGDFTQTIDCTLDAAPAILSAYCASISVSAFGANNGQLNVQAFGGVPPYTYIYTGTSTNLPVTGLTAGTYSLTINDSGEGEDLQTFTIDCEVGTPDRIDYPDNLCLEINVCGTNFNLSFTANGEYNYVTQYTLTNPSVIAITGMTLYNGPQGWVTSIETLTGTPQFVTYCGLDFTTPQVFFKSTTPNDVQPIGVWDGYGIFFNNTANVVPGECTNQSSGGGTPIVLPTVSTINITNATCTNNVGNVTLLANGGSGAPYTYYLNNSLQSGPTISNLLPGNYSAYVIDVNGNQSQTITFTITQQQPSVISMNLNTAIDSANVITDGPYTVNGAGGPYTNCYYTYRPMTVTATITGIPAGQTVTGYFVIKTKIQGAFTDGFTQTVWQGGGSSNMTITGYRINGSSQFIPSSTLISDDTLIRPNGINPSFLLTQESQTCVSKQTRKTIKSNTLNSITLNNSSVIEFDLLMESQFRPEGNQPSHGVDSNINGCTPGSAVQFEIEFIKTSPNINCYNFVFNNNLTPYIRSSKQKGPQTYLGPISTSLIIS